MAFTVHTDLPNINGFVRFFQADSKFITSGVNIKGDSDKDRIISMSLELLPQLNDLNISYRLVYNRIGVTGYFTNGEVATLNDRRRKVIGLAVKLTGVKSDSYDVVYKARLKNEASWIHGKNGSFCGLHRGIGAAIVELNILVANRIR